MEGRVERKRRTEFVLRLKRRRNTDATADPIDRPPALVGIAEEALAAGVRRTVGRGRRGRTLTFATQGDVIEGLPRCGNPFGRRDPD